MIKVLFILLVGLPTFCQAQTWAEWTRQKRTQRKYLAQQIAALQVFFDYAKQAYVIADKGLELIQAIKDGDFNMHQTYFNSLQSVNPHIKGGQKVASILSCLFQIWKLTKETLKRVQQNGGFTSAETASSTNTIDNILADCLNTIEELTLLISDNELQMTDDERIEFIDKLYTDMQDKKSFAIAFCLEMELLSIGRMVEEVETKRSRVLNGVK